MAKQQSGSHQPLSWPDRVRMNALRKHLHSRFHNVRMAALREVQAILRKQRGFRRRLADRVLRPAVRKVTPQRLHKTLGVQSRAPKAPKRTAPGPGTPWRGYKPLSDRPLTKADLKDRARDMKAGGRQQPQRQQSSEAARALSEQRQRDREAAQQAQRDRQAREARAGGSGQPARQPDLLRQAGLGPPPRAQAQAQQPRQFRTPLDVVATPGRNGRAPRPAPLPHETIRPARTQDKPRWARLRPTRAR